MDTLYPLDHRSMPPTLSRISDLTPPTTEARFIGPPGDLEQPLPPLKLERLWLQNMKPEAAARMAAAFDPVQLWLRNVQTADLGWIKALGRLQDLLIDWNTKLESFGFLRNAPPLKRLRADGLKRVHRLEGLIHQPSLKSLWIGGGIDRRLHVASLEPISRLVALEQLFLISLILDEPSLSPLARLSQLKLLRITSNIAPMEEYARLAGALPGVESDMLRGFTTLHWVLPPGADFLDVIDQLNGNEQVIMVGKGGRRFKVATDRERIVKELMRFRMIRDFVQQRDRGKRG